MHALLYEPSNVTVNEEGSVENYCQYAEGLLVDRCKVSVTAASGTTQFGGISDTKMMPVSTYLAKPFRSCVSV